MGLINFIRQNLPESWEKAATEMKMKSELITRLHANVPRIYKIDIITKKECVILGLYLTYRLIS